MGNSTLPTVLDKLCMVANINTRKLTVLKAEIKIRETKIQALQEMIDSLENKINEHERALSSIEGLFSLKGNIEACPNSPIKTES
jgi:SMC interacting uncharacterized protein involved in chromosome segregation